MRRECFSPNPEPRTPDSSPMMDVGFWELILLGAIVLIVAGPERLPGIARSVGRWVGRARTMSRNFKTQFEQELHDMESRQQKDNKQNSAHKPENGSDKHGE